MKIFDLLLANLRSQPPSRPCFLLLCLRLDAVSPPRPPPSFRPSPSSSLIFNFSFPKVPNAETPSLDLSTLLDMLEYTLESVRTPAPPVPKPFHDRIFSLVTSRGNTTHPELSPSRSRGRDLLEL
ncbi:hypothetical protein BDY24DRAFT_242747 [Mrakia frigida]|uniref:uncharacterized protein n=1 Tax=Mrakia frigida TaxID=29902 RepID=UPI003FCC12A4